MSAQAGVWNFDGKPADRDLLQNFSNAIARHAPDGENTHFGGSLGMLYRPFHTTRESRLEQQPYLSARGFVITWDGRLDNRDDLLSQLHGSFISPQTDLAIVTAAFERWGTDCFHQLIGDWALSIWDPEERTLILAKDYMGIRHLYYHLNAARVIWCTYIAPIALLSGVSFTVNDEYIAGYLALYPAAHLTPYREIQTVPPGSFVTIRNRVSSDRRYWAFEPGRIRYKTDAEYEEHFRSLFRRAVRRRLRSDSPVLAELSGGIDSSSIVCMADDIVVNAEAQTPQLDTISYYDPRVPGADERLYVTEVEERRNRKGHHIDIETYGDDFFCLDSGEFPTAPGPSEHLEGVRAHVFSLFQGHRYRVLLNGMGGDEFLGGFPNPQSQLADLILLPQPIKLVKQLAAWSESKKRHWIQLLFETLLCLLPVSLRATFAQQARIEPWIDSRFARRYRLGARRLNPQGRHGFWWPSHREFAQAQVAVRRQLAFFRPHFLLLEERRYPFLDQDLLEFLSAIPASQLLRPRQRRSLMRRALVDIVPHKILWRNTKGGGSPSFLVSFQRNRAELERLFVSPLSARMGYLNQNRFLDNLQTLKDGNMQSVAHLAKALYLEVWLRALVAHGVIRSCTEGPGDQVGLHLPESDVTVRGIGRLL